MKCAILDADLVFINLLFSSFVEKGQTRGKRYILCRVKGEVAEWLKALVSKTSRLVRVSGVQISPSPQLQNRAARRSWLTAGRTKVLHTTDCSLRASQQRQEGVREAERDECREQHRQSKSNEAREGVCIHENDTEQQPVERPRGSCRRDSHEYTRRRQKRKRIVVVPFPDYSVEHIQDDTCTHEDQYTDHERITRKLVHQFENRCLTVDPHEQWIQYDSDQ